MQNFLDYGRKNKKLAVTILSLIILSGCANSNATEEAPVETAPETSITSASAAETTIVTTESVSELYTEETTMTEIIETTDSAPETTVTEASETEETTAETDAEIVDCCILTREAAEAAHPEIEGRTEEEVHDLLSVLTDDELKTLCPTDEDLDIFIQMARGREGNMFRDVTLDSIAKAAADSSIYYNADCDIVFDYEGNEGAMPTT